MAVETEYDRFEDDEAVCASGAERPDEQAGGAGDGEFGAAEGAEADADDEGDEELYEVEVDEGAIVGYLVDEDDNEIGFIIEEDGREVEYYYADEDGVEYVEADSVAASHPGVKDDDEFDLGITREGVAEATDDMNAVFREGVALGRDLKDALSDISEGFGDLPFKKKK